MLERTEVYDSEIFSNFIREVCDVYVFALTESWYSEGMGG
jgi:hypothetical protein